MKKFVAIIVSAIVGLYSWWSCFLGTIQIFKEYGFLNIGNGILSILAFIISILIAALAGCCIYFDFFKEGKK